MIKKINFDKVLPNGIEDGGFINKYVKLYLEEDDDLARNILESIYFLGRGFATKNALKLYFNISDSTLRTKLDILYNLNLIEYRSKNKKTSHIALGISGASFIQKRKLLAVSNINPRLDKSNNLYFIASLLKDKGHSTFFLEKREDRDSILSNNLASYIPGYFANSKEESIARLEEKHIYLLKQESASFVYALSITTNKASTVSTLAISIVKKIISAIKFTSTYINLYTAKISFIIVVNGENTHYVDKAVKTIKNNDFSHKNRLELLNYLASKETGLGLEDILNYKITIKYNTL